MRIGETKSPCHYLHPAGLIYHLLSCITCTVYCCRSFIFLVFLSSHLFARLFAPRPTRNSDLGSPSRLFPSLRTTVRAFIFIATKLQDIFSPRRLSSNCAYPNHATSTRSQQLIPSYIFVKKEIITVAVRFEFMESNSSSDRGYTTEPQGRPDHVAKKGV